MENSKSEHKLSQIVDESAPKGDSRSGRNQRIWWIVCSILFYVGGVFIVIWATHEKTEDEVLAVLAWSAIAGLGLSGFGQLLQAATHGSVGAAPIWVEGYGKVLSLIGWSLGLTSGIVYAAQGGSISEVAAGNFFGSIVVIPLYIVMVSLGVYALHRKFRSSKEVVPKISKPADEVHAAISVPTEQPDALSIDVDYSGRPRTSLMVTSDLENDSSTRVQVRVTLR